jgi:hypothetical protein
MDRHNRSRLREFGSISVIFSSVITVVGSPRALAASIQLIAHRCNIVFCFATSKNFRGGKRGAR